VHRVHNPAPERELLRPAMEPVATKVGPPKAQNVGHILLLALPSLDDLPQPSVLGHVDAPSRWLGKGPDPSPPQEDGSNAGVEGPHSLHDRKVLRAEQASLKRPVTMVSVEPVPWRKVPSTRMVSTCRNWWAPPGARNSNVSGPEAWASEARPSGFLAPPSAASAEHPDLRADKTPETGNNRLPCALSPVGRDGRNACPGPQKGAA